MTNAAMNFFRHEPDGDDTLRGDDGRPDVIGRKSATQRRLEAMDRPVVPGRLGVVLKGLAFIVGIGVSAWLLVPHLDFSGGYSLVVPREALTRQRQSFRVEGPVLAALRWLQKTSFDLDELHRTLRDSGVAEDVAQQLAETLVRNGFVGRPPISQATAIADIKTMGPGSPKQEDLARDPILQGIPPQHEDCWLIFQTHLGISATKSADLLRHTVRDLSMPSPEHRVLRNLFTRTKNRFQRSVRLSTFLEQVAAQYRALLAECSDASLYDALSEEPLGPRSGHHPICAHV